MGGPNQARLRFTLASACESSLGAGQKLRRGLEEGELNGLQAAGGLWLQNCDRAS